MASNHHAAVRLAAGASNSAPRQLPKCSVCHQVGHKITDCKDESAPAARAARARTNAAKAAKRATEMERKYRIQLDALDLHQPDIMPGLVTHAYAEQCHTPSGCIDAVLPEKAVEMIVKFMNLRREARVARSFTKMADETRKRRKVAAGREKAVAAKKGRPGVYGGGRVVKKKLEVATQVQSVRVGSKRKRKRPLHDIPLWSEPITTSGFKRFLAVWVYAADIGVKEIKKLWNTNERRQKKETKAIKGKKFQRAYRGAVHDFARCAMSRDEYFMYAACFRFEQEEVDELEKLVGDQMLEFWVPATAACVDESLVPHKGRNNPIMCS